MKDFKLHSHPEKLLYSHLKNVGEISHEICASKKMENNSIFSDVSYLVGVAHDFGKSTTYFQQWLFEEKRTSKTYHSSLSALFGYYLVKNYLKKNKLDGHWWFLAPIAWIIISKHHSNLGDLNNDNLRSKYNKERDVWENQVEDIKQNWFVEVNDIYRELTSDYIAFDLSDFINALEDINYYKELQKELEHLSMEGNKRYYACILFLYSILLDADKLDATGKEELPARQKLDQDLVDRYKAELFEKPVHKIDEIREKAYKEVVDSLQEINLDQNRFLSITLPTGAGKTLTVTSFALKLRNEIQKKYGFIPKIIYSLPFLSIIEQNSEVIRKMLSLSLSEESYVPSNLLLKHHYLSDVKYTEASEDDDLYTTEDMNTSLLLTESWYSEIVVTTFVQFFHSLFNNKNRSLRKFHNITNSIILLDEVQAIPYKYWSLFKETLEYLAEQFNCWIVLMTATQPLIFNRNEVKELTNNSSEYFGQLDRVDYYIDLETKTLDSLVKEVLNKVYESEEDIMVALNTITSCEEVYNQLKDEITGLNNVGLKWVDDDGVYQLKSDQCGFETCGFENNIEIIYMSTHILPHHRLSRIERINKDCKRKLVVTTQLVEAGVDTSVDRVYRDLAPLPSIIQIGGRSNREGRGEKRGKVKVVQLIDDDNNRTYSSYIYSPILLEATKEVLNEVNSPMNEKNLNEKIIDYYYKVLENGAQNESDEKLDNMKKLEFDRISTFNLIEEDNKEQIFVELDEKAEKIRRKIEDMKHLDWKERRNEWLKIKKDMHSYTLSVNKKETQGLPSISGNRIKYIPRTRIKEWYNSETGFQKS